MQKTRVSVFTFFSIAKPLNYERKHEHKVQNAKD